MTWLDAAAKLLVNQFWDDFVIELAEKIVDKLLMWDNFFHGSYEGYVTNANQE